MFSLQFQILQPAQVWCESWLKLNMLWLYGLFMYTSELNAFICFVLEYQISTTLYMYILVIFTHKLSYQYARTKLDVSVSTEIVTGNNCRYIEFYSRQSLHNVIFLIVQIS